MKISIVIPTFERPQLLERLLLSISKQAYRYYEVIVVDDASTCQVSYEKVIQSYKCQYFRNDQNYGAPYSRNRGIAEASGSWLALVDDDDEWLPEKLQKQVEVVTKGIDNLGLIYTWTKVIKDNNTILDLKPEHRGNCLAEILTDSFIPSPSVLVKREAIIEAGLFDLEMPSCQDWDMWTRIFERGYICDFIPEFLTLYHKHDGPSIGTSSQANSGYKKYYQKHLPLLWKHNKKLYIKTLISKLKNYLT